MSSAAARLQAAHEQQQQQQQQQLNSSKQATPDILTQDPFPVAQLAPPVPTPKNTSSNLNNFNKNVNVDDESAFPTLGAPTTANASAPKSLWGGGGAAAFRVASASTAASASPALSRSSTPVNGTDFFSTTLQLPTCAIHISAPPPARGQPRGFSNDRRDDPKTLGEVIKEVMRRQEGVDVQASSSSKMTTFLIKAKGKNAEKRVEKTKSDLLGFLEKKVTEQVEVPAGLRAVIIGAKGRTLKTITDSTGASIQIPRDDELLTSSSDAPTTAEDDSEDGPKISITLSGASTAVSAARDQILAIVRERTSKTTLSVPDVPVEYFALLGARVKGVVERLGLEEEEVQVVVPVTGGKRGEGEGIDVVRDVTEGGEVKMVGGGGEKEAKEEKVRVSGEKETVKRVVEALEAEVADLRATVRPITFQLPKRQHRLLLLPSTSSLLLSQTSCVVVVPSLSSPSEDLILLGPSRSSITAMQLVLDLAASTPIETLDLFTAHRGTHDPKVYAAQIVRYLVKKNRMRKVAKETGTRIYLPDPRTLSAKTNGWLEIVGSAPAEGAEAGSAAAGVAAARSAVIAEVRRLPPSVLSSVQIDSLIHRHLTSGKKGARVRQEEKERGVVVVWPSESEGEESGEEGGEVGLVYEGGEAANAAEALEAVRDLLTTLAAEFNDLTTSRLSIPSSLHPSILGQNGTTLNAVLGEEKLVAVSFAKDGGDEVTVRGPKGEVERVEREIRRIAEDAKNEEIVNSHVVEFEIDSSAVRHVVGKSGSGVSKMRDDLGVRVDFPSSSSTPATKGAKATVIIKGRKENAEEAKRRILSLVDRIGDEVNLSIPLPASLDRGSLIGKQGTYLKRLEEKYEVRINFPKSSSSDTPSAPAAEITIRGPSAGAKAAKGELVSLIEYEKEHGNTLSFSVPSKALGRILGRGGENVNRIKDDTGVASLDINDSAGQGKGEGEATITLRGTKGSIKKAREEIEKVGKEVEDEKRVEVEIPKEFHTVLIGSGGSSIRDLIARCGGPTDARASGNTVRFPRQGDAKDTVIITAPSAVASKIRDALLSELSTLQSRIIYGVIIPQSHHAAIIGKGASSLQDLQRKFGVKVVFSGWNDYTSTGEIENPEDVKDANEADIVKVTGARESVLEAAEALKAVKPRGGPSFQRNGGGANGAAAAHSEEVSVPKHLHAQVAQGGRFFRTLPSGIRITHKGVKPPSSALKAKKAPSSAGARIDEEDVSSDELAIQVVALNDSAPSASSAGADDNDSASSEIPWVVEGSTPESVASVASSIRQSVDKAREASHVGFVTVPRGLMPRIVGRGGTGLDRLRASGVEVEVVGKRDANQLTLTGSPAAIDSAYETIKELNAPRPQRREARIDDDY